MATRFLVAGRLAGDPTNKDWWFLITELQVVTLLDERMKDVILEAKRRGVAVRGENEEIRTQIQVLLKSAS